jgi:5-methylcytosine-specific restriction endonuclease McrA
MSWNGRGSTTAWRKQRRRILSRDQGRCRIQLAGCTGLATQVHHTLGRGVSETDESLISACAHCNGVIGDPTKHVDPAVITRTKW